MFTTPILFLIFNREDTTRRVFEAIRLQKPRYLYVAADGPRKNKEGEVENCRRTREIINEIDWDCELKTLFREENLGCKNAVFSAISWFFENEEQGIILEDDCLPDASFFKYCEELLDRYREDERIGHISGDCFFPQATDKNYSYNFSSFSHIWGWASWRRVWQNVDLNLPEWDKIKHDKKRRKNLFTGLGEEIYFSSFLADSLANRDGKSVWDAQYLYSLRMQNQLSIYPTVNMVTNIGLNLDNATHTTRNNDKHSIDRDSMQFPLKHPEYIIRNKDLDKTTVRKLFFSFTRLFRYLINDY